MEKQWHFVVVCGYGCNLDSPLKPYLDRVLRFCGREKPEHILLCGGATQKKSFPSWTEADVMSCYLKGPLDCTYFNDAHETPLWHPLRDSYTTYYNIHDAAHLILNRLEYPPPRITIFCEATRSANVVMLARHFMGGLVGSIDDITVETGSWERADPFKQAGNLIYNKLAITFPWLHLAEREQRRRMRRSLYL